MLINFSNHPSTGWGQEQLEAAKAFGEIVDLQFPQVAPEATAQDIRQMADDCVRRILEIGNGHELTVHIMGEMTLIFNVVTALKKHGVRCVAATTQRISTEVDGKKISEFHFIQFREY